MAKTLEEIEAKRAAQRKKGKPASDGADDSLQAALVAIDPTTG